MIILLQLLFSFGVKLVLCGGLKGFEDCTPSRQTFITVRVTSCYHVLKGNLLTSIRKLIMMLSHLPKSVSPLTGNHKLPSIISARRRTTRISVPESRRPLTQLRTGRKEDMTSSSVVVAIHVDRRGVEVYKAWLPATRNTMTRKPKRECQSSASASLSGKFPPSRKR